MEPGSFFIKEERIDDIFILKVLEEGEKKFASTEFCLLVYIFESTSFEEIVESKDGKHLSVSNTLQDAAHSVIFDCDVHWTVILPRNVEQSDIVS